MVRPPALLTLPAHYQEVAFWHATSFRKMLLLNAAGLVLFIIGGGVFLGWFVLIHGVLSAPFELFDVDTTTAIWIGLAGLLVLTPLHEWLHGVAIRYYGLEPRYGFKPLKGVAFATPRAGYLYRRQYQVLLLTPLVGIGLLSLVGIMLTGEQLGLWWMLWGSANTASAIGDVWMAWVAADYAPDTLVRDEEDGMRFFRPLTI